jgi:hypothetical protein
MLTVHAVKQVDHDKWALLLAEESLGPKPGGFTIVICDVMKVGTSQADGFWTPFEEAAEKWNRVKDIRSGA